MLLAFGVEFSTEVGSVGINGFMSEKICAL